MTTDLIAQAEAALDGVTPGPWETSSARWPVQIGCCPLVGQPVSAHHNMRNVAAANTEADIRFIAWCRAGVPSLIARIRELEGERDAERKAKQGLAIDVLAASGQAQEAYDAQLAAETELEQAEDALAAVLRREHDANVAAFGHMRRAEAAEAKLAEVEKERDWQKKCRAEENEKRKRQAKALTDLRKHCKRVEAERNGLARKVAAVQHNAPFAHSEYADMQARIVAQRDEIRRLRAAEATVATLTAQVEAMREERDDAISTLNAWFDRRKLSHEAVDKAVVDAASGYLRTSRVGGMPQEESDLILGVIQDMARLSLFADLFARAALTTENQTNG